MSVLLIDNHDSYTWNLAHLIAEVTGELPLVRMNDAIAWDEFVALAPTAVVLSPGPGHPENARDIGICRQIIERWDGPLLGVCLGHQAMAWSAGGRVERAPEAMHGRLSAITHDARGIFEGLPQGIQVVRYHSLHVPSPIPTPWVACAWSEDGVVQGIRHPDRPQFGVQFHPESISTDCGRHLVERFLSLSGIETQPRGSLLPRPTPMSAARVVHVELDEALPGAHIFACLFHGQHGAGWLDSAGKQGDNRSRYSILGACSEHSPILTWRHGKPATRVWSSGRTEACTEALESLIEHPLRHLRVAESSPLPFCGGWMGWLGYGMKARWRHGRPTPHRTPDLSLAWVDRFVIVDHKLSKTYICALSAPSLLEEAHDWITKAQSMLQQPSAIEPRRPHGLTFEPTVDQSAYESAVRQSQERILDGESYEVCLTQQLVAGPLIRPFDAYLSLREHNPAPYSAFLAHPDATVCSSSPEQFISVSATGAVQARPIKGTAPRFHDHAADEASRERLSNSEKDQAENLMIVDLLRNDLGRVCQPHTVRVPALNALETFPSVYHLVSTIQGQLRPDYSTLDAIIAAFPPGSMTGAPKERTVEILDELEAQSRGIYSGAIGYLSACGSADLSVVIRSAVCEPDRTTIGVGGAITVLSEPTAEWEEALLKGRAVREALR